MLAWQIEQEMKALSLTKNAMARRTSTSRAQADRLLDLANTSVAPHTLQKARVVHAVCGWSAHVIDAHRLIVPYPAEFWFVNLTDIANPSVSPISSTTVFDRV